MANEQSKRVVRRVTSEAAGDQDARPVSLHTNEGEIHCRLHDAAAGEAAVLWVFGAGGGFNGPAGGLYPRLSRVLGPHGIAGLELSYRHPAVLEPCVDDVHAGIVWLRENGRRRVVLVGHSFGGAVVISAAAASPDVIGVAALSSQSYGADGIADVAPRPVLLIHGRADTILSDACSRHLHQLAREPKQLILYAGCGHGLDECRQELDRDLTNWMLRVCAE
jgi:pimeloyl-ACP methyl ester carboxylesterase